MKDQEIELNTAILAWKKGFPKKLGKITQSLLQRWLREVHNIYIFISSTRISDNKRNYEYDVQQDKDLQRVFYKDKILTYEQALEEGLCEALKLI